MCTGFVSCVLPRRPNSCTHTGNGPVKLGDILEFVSVDFPKIHPSNFVTTIDCPRHLHAM